MTAEKAFVFIDGLAAQPVLCGLVTFYPLESRGEFQYHAGYLARPDVFALDPINLPLSDIRYSKTTNKGSFGALADATCDAWGRKTFLALYNASPQNYIKLLLTSSGSGIGALLFSQSTTPPSSTHKQNTLSDLPLLIGGAEAILEGHPISKAAKKRSNMA